MTIAGFDIKHYFDAAPTLASRPRSGNEPIPLFVTQVSNQYRANTLLGTVQNIHPHKHEVFYGALFRVTTEGNFVNGSPAYRDNLGEGHSVLFQTDDGEWGYGVSRGTSDREGYSHRVQVHSTSTEHFRGMHPLIGAQPRDYIHVKAIFPPAPWADECWPKPTDHADVVEAKMELAGRKWKKRNAQFGLLRQSAHRHWANYAKQLEDTDHRLPTPLYSTIVTGTAFLSEGFGDNVRVDALNEALQANVAMVAGQSVEELATATLSRRQVIMRDFSFLSNVRAHSQEDATSQTLTGMTGQYEHRYGHSALGFNALNAAPVLAGIA